MNKRHTNSPMPVHPPPEPAPRELEPLLGEPFARVWDRAGPPAGTGALLRQRLLERTANSLRAERPMCTVRRRRAERRTLAEGIDQQVLYTAADARNLRRGEPLRVRLIELAAGSKLTAELLGPQAELQACQREWLVLSGDVDDGTQSLSLRDYHVTPAGHPTPGWTSRQGALLFLREALVPMQAGDRPHTVFDAQAGWPEFAPGIRRRVLWSRDGQAALLYHAEPGASVPNHSHGHDEECLMVQGELFLDDLLLQPGDYQLAPAGTGHHVTETDTGVVIYAHGDLDLRFVN